MACQGGGAPQAVPNPQVAADLARLREVTRPYRNLDAAVAAGYPREVKDCIVHEHHGAMGYHHLNRNFWPRDTVAPTFLGRTMKPEANFKYWYLHVWVWKENPDGIFADFDPSVQCPGGNRTVYRPSPPSSAGGPPGRLSMSF